MEPWTGQDRDPCSVQVNSRELVAKHVKKIRMEAVKNVEKIQHHTEEHDRFYTKVITVLSLGSSSLFC
jgi:hypothetical protein